jgi:ribosome-associated heat shock protein Hsp15
MAGEPSSLPQARVQHEGVIEPVRADRWLWAARFVKTRTGAVEAITAGHVELAGGAIKASRLVGPGDQLTITIGHQHFEVVVLATAARRGSASDAALLYQETAPSRAERERQAELRRLAAPPGADLGRRPTKRDRRLMDQARHPSR